MKPYVIALALVGSLMGSGGAFAYHPMDRWVRGTLEADQREQIEFEHTQRGWLPGTARVRVQADRGAYASTPSTRRPARPSQRRTSPGPRFPTEHHTR